MGKGRRVAMRIVARRGKSQLFLAVDDDTKMGQVIDKRRNKFYPPMNFQSILAMGYWEPYQEDETPSTKEEHQ